MRIMWIVAAALAAAHPLGAPAAEFGAGIGIGGGAVVSATVATIGAGAGAGGEASASFGAFRPGATATGAGDTRAAAGSRDSAGNWFNQLYRYGEREPRPQDMSGGTRR